MCWEVSLPLQNSFVIWHNARMKKLTASEFETDLVVAGIDPSTLLAISENSEPI